MSDKHTAYHEAGHAAALVLLSHGSDGASIVQDHMSIDQFARYGRLSLSTDGAEMLAIALYAGAEAEKRINADHKAVKDGADRDAEKAKDFLKLLHSTEDELRERTTTLISEHWGLVELIASQLLIYKSMEGGEVEIVLQVYQGKAKLDDVKEYRVNRGVWR